MNKTILGLIAGLVLGSGATWFLLHSKPAASAPAAAEAAAKPEEKSNPLHLPPAQRTQAGITLAKPEARTVAPEVEGFGRILDSTSFATIVAEIDTARAALAASEKELARVQKLFAAGANASAQAVETAEAAVARDRATLASAQARMGVTWGREVAAHAADLSAALADGAALVRIDLLPGESAAPDAKQARVLFPGRSGEATAEVVGRAPAADTQVQGVGYLALLRQPALGVGAAFRATLPGAGEAANVLVIPRGAIVYHQGSAWVFVLGEEDTFERKLVTLGRNVGADTIAIASGLDPDGQVVATGAQQLLAAELQAGGAPEEP